MALEWLKQRSSELVANMKSEVAKFRNKTFLEATVAGCVIVAHADGVVKPEEKQKMMGFLRTHEALSVFDVNEAVAIFEKYAKNFEFDYQIGQANALQAVAKLKGKDAEARLMVRVCCAVGASDGNFDDNEQAAVRTICTELGLNPKDFDLT
jgi:tellurite resistance protein TerB